MLERLFGDLEPRTAALLEGALGGDELGVDDAVHLLCAEGAGFHALMRAADVARFLLLERAEARRLRAAPLGEHTTPMTYSLIIIVAVVNY